MTKKPKLVAISSGEIENHGQNESKTMQEFYDEITSDVLARTLWGEARGEGTQGMQAVANVILNRVKVAEDKGSFWWGNNIIQVCQKPYQFSCWNRSDPNFRKLQSVDKSDLYFATAQRLAQRAVIGALEDITGGATHYHAKSVSPYWTADHESCAELGSHVFYRLV